MTTVNDETRDQLLEAIRSLQGTGYSSTGLRDLLIQAWAYAAAYAKGRLDVAGQEIFPQNASELLAEWQLFGRLPNDTARTNEEIALRIQALLTLGGHFQVERIGRTLELLGLTASAELQTPSGGDAFTRGNPEHIRQMALRIGAADYADTAIRKAIAEVFSRACPAAALGQISRGRSFGECICTAIGARYGNASAVDGNSALIGQTAIKSTEVSPTGTGRGWHAQRRPFGQLSILRAADLNDVQDRVLWHSQELTSPTRGISGHSPDAYSVLIVDEIPATSTHDVDQNIDWRDRLISASGAATTSDIRPNGASEAATPSAREAFWYSGTGGASYDENSFSLSINFRVDSTSGNLQVVNPGASPLYLIALVQATGRTGERTTPSVTMADSRSRYIDFDDGDSLSTFPTDFAKVLFEAGAFHRASQSDTSGGGINEAGAIRRVCLVDRMQSGFKTEAILDNSTDWRDRLISVDVIEWGTDVRPGITGDATQVQYPREFFYSGSGRVTNGDSWEHDWASTAGIQVFATSINGLLMVSIDGNFTPTRGALGLLITASEQLGYKQGSGLPRPQASPTTASEIYPRDLNVPQDCALFQQGQQRRVDVGGRNAFEVECVPLGPIGRGNPKLPVEHRIGRDQMWRFSGLVNEGRDYVFRQNVADRIAFFTSQQIPDGSSYVFSGDPLLERSRFDWRDRIVTVRAAFSTSDLRIGQAGDTGINAAADQLLTTWYTGPGDDLASLNYALELTTNLDLWVQEATANGTGSLSLSNTTGSTYYVVVMLEAGPQLGLRS